MVALEVNTRIIVFKMLYELLVLPTCCVNVSNTMYIFKQKNVMALADSDDGNLGFSLVETTTTTAAPLTTKAAATVAIATTKQMAHELNHVPLFL